MRSIVVLALVAMVGLPIFAGDETDAVRRAVLDYVEAIEQGKPELIERGVHPELQKFGFGRRDGAYRVIPMDFERLVEIATEMKAKGYVPEDASHSVEIFDVMDKTASAKLTAFWGIDYMHLAKHDDEWKIVHVLWQTAPEE